MDVPQRPPRAWRDVSPRGLAGGGGRDGISLRDPRGSYVGSILFYKGRVPRPQACPLVLDAADRLARSLRQGRGPPRALDGAGRGSPEPPVSERPQAARPRPAPDGPPKG